MTPEQRLWQSVKAGLERVAPGVHLCRIENLAGAGISDVNACLGGVEAWIELKIIRSGKIKFEPSQTAWIPRRMAAGGRVFILARDDKSGEVYLWTGLRCRITNLNPVIQCTKPVPWGKIARILFGSSEKLLGDADPRVNQL